MEIIDSQVHIWAASTSERPWSKNTGHSPHGPETYTADQALAEMDAAGIDIGVIVPPSFEGDRNDLALAAARDHPGRFLVNGRFDVSDPSNAGAILEALRDPLMIGVRLTFNKVAATWLRDGTIEWFFDLAEREGIVVSMYPEGAMLDLVDGIAGEHPELRLAIDHLATSTPEAGWDHLSRIRDFARLASRPNVAAKASALPISFPQTYSVATVRAVVDLLLDSFGPDRVFWGSDYTRYDSMRYGDTVEVFREGIAHLPEATQESIMGKALRRWHGLELT